MFYLKMYKCLFAQKTIEYLDHIISFEGVAPDKNKIEAIIIGRILLRQTIMGISPINRLLTSFIEIYASIAFS